MRAARPIVELVPAAGAEPAPELDEVQRAAAACVRGAHLVVGGPGSGKTTTLVAAMAARLNAGAAADRLLGLVSSQAAARRWRSAVAAQTGREPPMVTTVHGLALQLVQRAAQQRSADPPRLLAVGDQVQVVRDVLAAAQQVRWPAMYAEALTTRAFAEAVRDFIARAEAMGWTPRRLAAAAGAPAVWVALAAVWRKYARVLALSGSMDYSGLVRAALASARPSHGGWSGVFVDDYLDLDPSQVSLLHGLTAPGGLLIAAADPDLVVNRFRGAAPGSLFGFARAFPDASEPFVLTGSYRFGQRLEAARAGLTGLLPMAGVSGGVVRTHRAPRDAGPGVPDTTVRVMRYPDVLSEGDGIAGVLRRVATAGLAAGSQPRWRDAAVLVRSSDDLARIEAALTGAGVPVRGSSAGRWLADEPVVVLLATGLRLAAAAAGLHVDPPAALRVQDLLVSPFAGADPVDLRRLCQHLRGIELAGAANQARLPKATADLLMAAVLDPEALSGVDPGRFPAVRSVRAGQRRILAAARLIEDGVDAAGVLWTLWSDEPYGPGSWARRMRAAALSGTPVASSAHRGLDAAMALFAEAQRSAARGGGQHVAEFLADLPGMRWPGDRLAATSAEHRNAVWLSTAHRAAGRQWPTVVVAGVQEGVWPADAAGAGLLGEELLAGDGPMAMAARSEQVADERRLFHLACTRASRRLVVTCAEASRHDPSGPVPSRFLSELGVPLRDADPGAGTGQTATGIVAGLRRAAADPDRLLAAAAVERLAALQTDHDFPSASVAAWWGIAGETSAQVPLCEPDEPVTFTVTGLAEITACPWRWFVTRLLGAGRPEPTAAAIGRLVHRVHEGWAKQEIDRSMSEAERIVEEVWAAVPFRADWHSARRRREVADALVRLLAWHEANHSRIAFAEEPFDVTVALPDGDAVRLRGKADVALQQTEGLAVLDIKTAKSTPSRAEVAQHVQLAGYQLAVARGALGSGPASPQPGPLLATTTSAGAGLLMAWVPDGGPEGPPKIVWQPPLDDRGPEGAWLHELLATGARRMRAEEFPAVESAACRTCPVAALCPAKNPAQGVGR